MKRTKYGVGVCNYKGTEERTKRCKSVVDYVRHNRLKFLTTSIVYKSGYLGTEDIMFYCRTKKELETLKTILDQYGV